jgi:hypothetical protein
MGVSLLFLEEEEIAAVRWALENYLPELRYEAARIKRERDRHELVVQEQILTALLARLSSPEVQEAASGGIT